MQVLKLTGLQHGELDKLQDICPGNAVWIERQPEYDKEGGKAYKAMCKGVLLGYIPLVPTLRTYFDEANNDDQKDRIAQWGRACVKVRMWLDSRKKFPLVVRVQTILYDHDGKHLPIDNGKVAAVAVLFEEVE
jgi:hypothetical protein